MFPSRLPLVLSALMALAGVAGCSKSATTTSQGAGPSTAEQERPAPTEEAPPARAEMERDCPMAVPGAHAWAEDTSEGVALTFATSEPEQVADLRERGRNMMQRQQEQGTSGRRGLAQPPGMSHNAMGGSGLPGSAGAPSVPSSARIRDIPQGVAITYVALDPSEQQRLSQEIHATAGLMAPGACPGMAPPVE